MDIFSGLYKLLFISTLCAENFLVIYEYQVSILPAPMKTNSKNYFCNNSPQRVNTYFEPRKKF